MKRFFRRVYDFFHICRKGKLYSTLSERDSAGKKIRQENEYYCRGFFCDKKIKVRII